jgi:hypothetical protein
VTAALDRMRDAARRALPVGPGAPSTPRSACVAELNQGGAASPGQAHEGGRCLSRAARGDEPDPRRASRPTRPASSPRRAAPLRARRSAAANRSALRLQRPANSRTPRSPKRRATGDLFGADLSAAVVLSHPQRRRAGQRRKEAERILGSVLGRRRGGWARSPAAASPQPTPRSSRRRSRAPHVRRGRQLAARRRRGVARVQRRGSGASPAPARRRRQPSRPAAAAGRAAGPARRSPPSTSPSIATPPDDGLADASCTTFELPFLPELVATAPGGGG